MIFLAMFHSLSVLILVTSATGNLVAKQAPTPPPSSPTLTFKIPPQVITCNSSTFSWDYSGPDLRMSLYITNGGVTQLDPPSLSFSPAPSPTTTRPLGAVPYFIALSAFEGLAPVRDTEFTWSSVAIPRGWYVLEAELRAANYTTRGAPFFVEESDDTSCLVVATPRPMSGAPRQFRLYSNKAGMLVGTFVLGPASFGVEQRFWSNNYVVGEKIICRGRGGITPHLKSVR
ncbi:hypothetical protein BDZ94DRAFT_1301574 [Collybia nuda]|uniref:Uncharacterized protein n=1 Tax=Collybia nuda TaxID=64659 RepID=A0A9P6CA60_9AGAR|nr:hypothetical protein BDZ94DRAFT_1301574 [Collybia nuda]